MAEPWIRVHANLLSKPVATRCAESLGISLHEAIGVLVTFWGAVSQHCVDGNIGQASDRQIELWAGWSKKRGRFATFVHEQHTDGHQRINEWDEYQGRLETRRKLDRDRQRTSRGRHADVTPSEPPPGERDNRVTSVPTRAVRDETIRNETNSNYSSPPANCWQPAREAQLAERLTTEAGRVALTAILHATQADVGKVAIVNEITMMLNGDRGPSLRPTPEQMDQALSDYVANGMSSDRWNAKHFAACVRSAMRPRDEQQTNGKRPTNTDRALAALQELKA